MGARWGAATDDEFTTPSRFCFLFCCFFHASHTRSLALAFIFFFLSLLTSFFSLILLGVDSSPWPVAPRLRACRGHTRKEKERPAGHNSLFPLSFTLSKHKTAKMPKNTTRKHPSPPPSSSSLLIP